VHILGATGSGKTESVILNFLRQDVARGFGSIILDAKGDDSFLSELMSLVPPEKLKWDRGNPTGHNVLFISTSGYTWCFVMGAGT
jgi:hypothetical protein